MGNCLSSSSSSDSKKSTRKGKVGGRRADASSTTTTESQQHHQQQHQQASDPTAKLPRPTSATPKHAGITTNPNLTPTNQTRPKDVDGTGLLLDPPTTTNVAKETNSTRFFYKEAFNQTLSPKQRQKQREGCHSSNGNISSGSGSNSTSSLVHKILPVIIPTLKRIISRELVNDKTGQFDILQNERKIDNNMYLYHNIDSIPDKHLVISKLLVSIQDVIVVKEQTLLRDQQKYPSFEWPKTTSTDTCCFDICKTDNQCR